VDPWICTEPTIGCDHPAWMATLDGSLPISQVSMPGTHETMASRSGGDPVICQSVQDLRLQLDAGIRALDIRCRHVLDRFAIHHAAYYQDAWFGEPMNCCGHWNEGDYNVLQACLQFLYDHPSEFIVMRVQETYLEESPTRSFAETLEWYVKEDGCEIINDNGYTMEVLHRDYFWGGYEEAFVGDYPTVDEVRGKIVLLQDFPTRYRVGNAPRRVITGEFNNDGSPDIATVNVDDDEVCVLLTDITSRNFEKRHFPVGNGPRDLCSADFDGDGIPDLAVVKFVNPGSNYMCILRGDGIGNFGPYQDVYVEDDPVGIAAMDLNLDGRPDLAIACERSNEISVMINRADAPGSFVRTDWTCGQGPRDVVSADFNQDGSPDLAVAKFNNPGHNYICILDGDGTGGFAPYRDYYVEDDPRSLVVTDVNVDGLPDLVIACQATNKVTVMTNNPDAPGTFYRFDRYCGGGPKDVVAGDFNLDSWPDLAVVKFNNPGHNYMAVLMNTGAGGFYDYVDYLTGDDPYGIAVVDINLDGKQDLVTCAISERLVEIFNGDGAGRFFGARYGLPWSRLDLQDDYVMYCTAESFNSKEQKVNAKIQDARQGPPGTMYMNFISGSTWINPIDAAGGCAGAQGMNQRTYNFLRGFLPGDAARCGVIMSDFPGPGLVEAVINQNDLRLIAETWPAAMAGNVSPSADVAVRFRAEMNEASVSPITFVVDGRCSGLHDGVISYDAGARIATLDPATCFEAGEIVSATLTTGVETLSGLPFGSYTWSFRIAAGVGPGVFNSCLTYGVGLLPRSVIAADLDGDQDLDLMVGNFDSGSVSVLMNEGYGTFASRVDYAAGDGARPLVTADLDHDGDVDLAVGNWNANSVSVLLNDGSGVLVDAVEYGVGSHPRSVSAADLDGDGDLDLVTANESSDNASVLLGRNDGTFEAQALFPVGDAPVSVVLLDFDGDGYLDLATANYWSDDVTVLLGNGNASFGDGLSFAAGDGPVAMCSADFDGDGDFDFATVNTGSGDVAVLFNEGDATFVAPIAYILGTGLSDVVASDFDGDGDSDLAVARWSSDEVAVLANNGEGAFDAPAIYTVGDAPVAMFACDLDGDSDMDLASSNEGSNDIVILVNSQASSVGDQDSSPFPARQALYGSVPNPFNPRATIAFELPGREAVTLRVFDTAGCLVKTVLDGEIYGQGRHEAVWRGRDDSGRQCASGTYFYRLEAGSFCETKRMTLLK